MKDHERFAEWRRTHPPIMGADSTTDGGPRRPPRDDLVRAMAPHRAELAIPAGLSLRAAGDAGGEGDGMTLFGHFAVFNRFTEIDSFWEGNFMERIAPGAFKKTFRESPPKILFQHGMDPQIGDRVIAAPSLLREDDTGSYYEARLFDGIDPMLLEGLRAGEYGASFRFSVMREEWVDEPDPSEQNPKGLPERTLKELRCPEFGPVTFPAYADATAAVRSMTDEVILGRATADPARLRAYLEYLEARDTTNASPAVEADPETSSTTAPSSSRAAETHPATERRETNATGRTLFGLPPKEKSWRL